MSLGVATRPRLSDLRRRRVDMIKGPSLCHKEPCSGETLERLTWKKDSFLATDVRPENALVAEATGMIHPIDFIVAGREIAM